MKKRSVAREQSVADHAADEWVAARISHPSQRLMLGEDAVLLSAALDALTEDQRTAIRLKFLNGYSPAEISQQMNRSPDAIVSLVRRGMMHLRTILDRNATAQTCAQ